MADVKGMGIDPEPPKVEAAKAAPVAGGAAAAPAEAEKAVPSVAPAAAGSAAEAKPVAEKVVPNPGEEKK